jgi:hypothetical protein
MIVQDNAYNCVKRYNTWKIQLFGCLSYSIHLKIGPLMVEMRKQKATDQRSSHCHDDIEKGNDDEDDDTDIAELTMMM